MENKPLSKRFLEHISEYLDSEEKYYTIRLEGFKARETQFESEKSLMIATITTGDINCIREVCNKIWGSDFKTDIKNET